MSYLHTPDFYEGKREGALRSASVIVPLVVDLVRPRSVVDVGCGTGTWLSVFAEAGVDEVMGIDGNHVVGAGLEIAEERFLAWDLSQSLRLERRFDLVVSLEVAEHLPGECAQTFVDSLVSLGPIVLFSAAVPLQGGEQHVNEQWPSYWVRRFHDRGYVVIDCLRERIWNEPGIDPWYAQNLMLYVCRDRLPSYPDLRSSSETTDLARLPRVHPRLRGRGSCDDHSSPAPLRAEHRVEIELTEPVRELRCPAGAECLVAAVKLEGLTLGSLRLPIVDGTVSRYVLEDAVSAKFGWQILGSFFGLTRYHRGGEARRPEESIQQLSAIHDDIGWVSFLQEIWNRPEWPLARFYDSRADDVSASARREIHGAGFRFEISDEPPELCSRKRWIRIVLTAGGIPFGAVTLRIRRGQVRAQELLSAVVANAGMELYRVSVREALLGRSLRDGVPLRERLRRAALASSSSEVSPSRPVGLAPSLSPYLAARPLLLLGRRDEGSFDTSSARRAILPPEAVDELAEASRSAREPTLAPTAGERPSAVVYAPEWVEPRFPAHRLWSRGAGFLARVPARWSTRRRVERMQSRLKRDRIVAAVERACSEPAPRLSTLVTDKLPILCYRRVTPERSAATEAHRVSPEAFEEQLRYFRDLGYYGVGLAQWRRALRDRKPLPGRALAFTFDGGYEEFLHVAWPLLREYGFPATVFLVAETVSRKAVADDLYSEQVSHLSWKELRRLARAGIDFGSLSCTRRPLTALSVAEVVREGARSRLLLQRGLGKRIDAFAYPHGHWDEVVAHVIGGSGYVFGLTCRPSRCTLSDSPLELPRIEVSGSESLAELVARWEL